MKKERRPLCDNSAFLGMPTRDIDDEAHAAHCLMVMFEWVPHTTTKCLPGTAVLLSWKMTSLVWKYNITRTV